MFCIGDYIVYDRYGICKIETISTPNFLRNHDKVYYTLCPPYSKSKEKIYVPVNTCTSMRIAISEKEALYWLEKLKAIKPVLYRSKKLALLTAHYQGMLSSCELASYLELLKEIYLKEKEARDNGKKLKQTDIYYQKIVERLLSEEFSIALNTTPNAMLENFRSVMGLNLQKR